MGDQSWAKTDDFSGALDDMFGDLLGDMANMQADAEAAGVDINAKVSGMGDSAADEEAALDEEAVREEPSSPSAASGPGSSSPMAASPMPQGLDGGAAIFGGGGKRSLLPTRPRQSSHLLCSAERPSVLARSPTLPRRPVFAMAAGSRACPLSPAA